MNKYIYKSIGRAAVLCVTMLALLTGCGGEVQQADVVEHDAIIKEAITIPEPETAVEEVYKTLKDAKVEEITDYLFSITFTTLDDEEVEKAYGCISDPNGGLADMLIIKPVSGEREKVREALHNYQQSRIREFENYDILDAYEISTNAQIYDQGDYVIFLMLPDNEAARDIIDLYIPL